MQFWLNLLTILLGILLGLALAALLFRKRLGPLVARLMGEAYRKKMERQLRKGYPQLADRFSEFDMSADRQEAIQAAMRRIPPQEGLKLQTEFLRLRENFLARHPELDGLFSGTDPRTQMKAFDSAMKLPAEQRAAIEKDLLWAWDQLRGRFPKLVGLIEAAARRREADPGHQAGRR
ncbi:MAG: hypothetical protein VKQ33_09515 [Candidatus Sericytochromatia bacterium]|nr:hypothetical protein [Candidatus Sericytochromatia bacterium]